MKKFLVLAALASLAGIATAADKIVIKGSDTLGAKMVPQMAEAYKALGNDVTFEIAAEGSSTGFAALKDGTADLGMSSRNEKDSEKAEIKGLKMHVVGIDMIAVIVNANNPLAELTTEQVKGIFTGAITDWSEVGGTGGEISVYTRNTSSGTYKTFQELAMDKEDYGSNTQKMAGNEQIAQEVGKNANGIGYVGLAYTSAPGIKTTKVDGVDATAANASKYPLSRNLYMMSYAGTDSAAALAFLDWAKTDPAAHKITEAVGFIAPEQKGLMKKLFGK